MTPDAPGPDATSGRSRAPAWFRAVAAAGIALWVVGLVALAALAWWAPVQAVAAFLAVTAFYYAGQFGAMPMGLAAGGHPVLVGLFVWAADVAGLLVFFPLTQWAVDRVAARPGMLGRWMRGLQARAHRHADWFRRYGPLGLFGFTIIPFLFNSPILGAVIGRTVGIPPRRTLTALLAAITLMTFLWTGVFYVALRRAQEVDGRLPWMIGLGSVALTFLIAGGLALARWVRARSGAPVHDGAHERL